MTDRNYTEAMDDLVALRAQYRRLDLAYSEIKTRNAALERLVESLRHELGNREQVITLIKRSRAARAAVQEDELVATLKAMTPDECVGVIAKALAHRDSPEPYTIPTMRRTITDVRVSSDGPPGACL